MKANMGEKRAEDPAGYRVGSRGYCGLGSVAV